MEFMDIPFDRTKRPIMRPILARPDGHGPTSHFLSRPFGDWLVPPVTEETKAFKARLRAVIMDGHSRPASLYFDRQGCGHTAIGRADPVLFIATAFIAVAATYMTDVFTVKFLLGRVGIRSDSRIRQDQGASYLLNIINYNLALVMMAAVVKKRVQRLGRRRKPVRPAELHDLSVFSIIVRRQSGPGSPRSRRP